MNDEVIAALESQVGCYRRLAKLAQLQHRHVEQDQMEPLLEVLSSRQAVVEQINRLEKSLRDAKGDWGAFMRQIDGAQRTQVEGFLAETRQLLESITTNDQNDAMLLQQRKLNLGRQINQASSARQVNRNYAVAAYGSRPSRMDVQR